MLDDKLTNGLNDPKVQEPICDIGEKELKEIIDKISKAFMDSRLHKGVSQVIKALDLHLPLSKIYQCGVLDSVYQKALDRCIVETKTETPRVVLPKKYTTLVYDTIKDINKNKTPRLTSRRFFQCRAFAF